MRASDVLISDTPSRGVRTLRGFLEYAETGRLEPQVTSVGTRPPGSDFEIAVLEGLRSLGYACDPQVGASGYFIDLAVRDPEQSGRYLLGIECDGATYHSTPSARDRDRLRQDILEEKLGWVIERVWSTDWFRDPDAELERLRRRIEDLRSRARRPPAPADEAGVEGASLEPASLGAVS
jgi:very-short-patch-repair endonuclease